MSFGLTIERLSEFMVKPVGLSINIIIHELTGFRFSHFDLDLPKIAFEFMEDRIEGMTLLSSAESHLCRPKCTHDKDPAPLDPAAQMKE
jgi:hypothetical protein